MIWREIITRCTSWMSTCTLQPQSLYACHIILQYFHTLPYSIFCSILHRRICKSLDMVLPVQLLFFLSIIHSYVTFFHVYWWRHLTEYIIFLRPSLWVWPVSFHKYYTNRNSNSASKNISHTGSFTLQNLKSSKGKKKTSKNRVFLYCDKYCQEN